MNSKKKTTSKRPAQKPPVAASKPAAKKATAKSVIRTTSSARTPAPKKSRKPPEEAKPKRTAKPAAKSAAPVQPSLSVATKPAAPVPAAKPAPIPTKLPPHLKVPQILLEDDTLPPELMARFTPAPEPEPEPSVTIVEPPPAPSLPPHYGTRQLSLIARDPFTLFADWDFSAEEIGAAQKVSPNGQVLLRIFRGEVAGPMVVELPVDPARRHAFIPAPISGVAYRAVLGLITHDHEWHELARSSVALVPPEAAPTVAVEKAAPPPMVRVDITEPMTSPAQLEPMLPAWIRLASPVEIWPARSSSITSATWHAPVVMSTWSPAQTGASELLIGPGVLPGTGGAAPVSKIGPDQGPSSLETGLSSAEAVPASPEAGRDFWFKVNAEVVIYGSTERDAKVTVDGRPVRLRADGSFSFRFSLPDGEFTLPVKASASDGYSPREIVFHLDKVTERRGQIGTHPQDPSLRPPLADNAVPE
jgi:hypothetical protein